MDLSKEKEETYFGSLLAVLIVLSRTHFSPYRGETTKTKERRDRRGRVGEETPLKRDLYFSRATGPITTFFFAIAQ